MKIGVIGNGFVGNAVASGFIPLRESLLGSTLLEVFVYDIDKSKSPNTLEETLQCNFVFVCLPTPMTDAEGGRCNLSLLEKFFDDVSKVETEAVFIIKSTVPVGTTDRMCELYPHMKIAHNPEFLTAANAVHDFVNADRHVVGGEPDVVSHVETLYKTYFPNTKIFTMKSKESECVKYFANCFLAAKVMVFNEMKMLCNNIDVDYNKILRGVGSDHRIGHSHTFVPGPDGDYGFGGTCFPKDINSLINIMIDNDVDPIVLKSVWEQNKNYRETWDWSDNQSAVLKQSEEYRG